MSFVDPFDAATQAGERTPAYFGKIEVSVGFVKLMKGAGKVPFNEGTDSVEERRTDIRIVLNPIEASKMTQLVEKDMIAESATWGRIVWPSLRDCGLKNLRELHGKWAQVELAKTGRTYPGRDGTTREETTFKFVKLFDSLAECNAAFYAVRPGSAPVDNGVGDIDMSHGAGSNGNGNGGNPERETALQFLGVLVKQAGGDKSKLAASIAMMPMISKYFTADSPEVVNFMAGVN